MGNSGGAPLRGAVGLVSSFESDKTQKIVNKSRKVYPEVSILGEMKTIANGKKSVKKSPCWGGCAAAMWTSGGANSGPRAPLATSPKWATLPSTEQC